MQLTNLYFGHLPYYYYFPLFGQSESHDKSRTAVRRTHTHTHAHILSPARTCWLIISTTTKRQRKETSKQQQWGKYLTPLPSSCWAAEPLLSLFWHCTCRLLRLRRHASLAISLFLASCSIASLSAPLQQHKQKALFCILIMRRLGERERFREGELHESRAAAASSSSYSSPSSDCSINTSPKTIFEERLHTHTHTHTIIHMSEWKHKEH